MNVFPFPMRRFLPLAWACVALLLLPHQAGAYGPVGHQIVGAIADQRLGSGPTAVKLRSILQGYTLEKAAVIPDEIKGWDKDGVDDPNIFRYTSRPRLDAELADFWRANPPTRDLKSPIPNHHWSHYTDVPILNRQKYSDGKTGRSQWDIVQTMKLCIGVLRGEIPEDNPRKVTKTVAVLLLAHFVGDIHQPLHVGAPFFDEKGNEVDPDKTGHGLENQGGNTFRFDHSPAAAEATGHKHSKLHGFWDTRAVLLLLPQISKELPKEEKKEKMTTARRELAMKLAAEEPKGWRPPPNVKPGDYPELWANEILPLAREAYGRLQFNGIVPTEKHGHMVAVGNAQEKQMPDGVPYHEWASKVIRVELHKAGWRLADLLEKSLQ